MPNTRETIKNLLMQKGFGVEGATIATDHLIANGVTVQKWIPVTERLPEKNGTYLVLWTNKAVSDAEYESTYKSFGYWIDILLDTDEEWIAYQHITHWMPLPEPPKGA